MDRRDYFSNSPFTPWLKTNCSLPDRGRARIEDFLIGPTEELTAIDTQIEALVKRRSELRQGVDSHKSLLHPVRNIPSEILREIFCNTLPERHCPPMTFSDAPLSLTAVSRKWRDIALTTPRLWAAVHIVVNPQAQDGEVQIQMERVRNWFRLAGNSLLSVSVASMIDHNILRPIERQLLDVILLQWSRIRVLNLRTSDEVLNAFAFHQCSWPMLEKVVVDMDQIVDRTRAGEPCADKIAADSVTLWQAPNLRSLEWRTIDELFFYTRQPHQWKDVEEILMSSALPGFTTGKGFGADVVRTMLRATERLSRLRIAISGDEDEDGDEDIRDTYYIFNPAENGAASLKPYGAELTLNHLTMLDLVDTWASPSPHHMVTPFLHNLYLPVLTSLTYTLRPTAYYGQRQLPKPVPLQHPLVLFMRAQPRPSIITNWTVSIGSICREGLVECLRLMPYLERLWIKSVPGTKRIRLHHATLFDDVPDEGFLGQLVHSRAGSEQGVLRASGRFSVCCPKLHSIRIDQATFSMDALHTFLEVRIGLALLSQGSITSRPNLNSVAVLRLVRVQMVNTLSNLKLSENLLNPVVEGSQFGCKGNASRCSLAEDCRRLGVKVQYVGYEERVKGWESDELLKAGRSGLHSVVIPRFGLPSDDGGWV
ncbi:hypothetical protein NMY22_g8651 [Coprinellus aureogranulatus]|nr:hypothetical protein NMY22_g8651 [Coprinellus aureogranulatus]